ncbi:amidohydrolase [Mucilaginibacter psychrotolerans]|uniref:Amidohydrolase n=1 Tax=Mucilaginibacter psychrotolerans TaxID=1524096 RepID=A0A4Y8SA73_9SPHI|nr:amidohydrolase [Mucilaginibacter psychrotolerans]TFF35929.1 amidohydrolase [Mucilaginibacter psychrotolerans]
MKKLLALIVLIALYLPLHAQQADLILTGGNIITLKQKGHRAQALAMANGRILAVGSNIEIAKYAGKNTKIIKLNGKTVIPGFNDVHQHPAPVYPFEALYATIRVDTVTSMKNLIALVKRKAAITPKGMLIRGVGYNETLLGGQPIRDSLDKATSEHPVLLSHVSGHLSAANSFLMDKAGINESTKDPAGGLFERYPGTNKPDGICKESAAGYLRRAKITNPPKPTDEEEMAGYRLYFNQVLASGVTSIGDANTSPQKVAIYRKLVAEQFPMRFNLLIWWEYLDQVLNGTIPRTETDFLRIAGIKVVQGNSLSGKTCWLNDPYDMINPLTGKRDYYGIPPARSQAGLDSLFLAIHNAGWQIACHSNGDREIAMVISSIEKAMQQNPRPDPRHRIEHCSLTTMKIMEDIKRDGIIPVFHCYLYELGEKMAVYGEERLKMLHPTRTAQDMGIVYALHSDAPISTYPAMIRLGSAVARKTKEGNVIGANQCVDAEDAIKAYCYGGAYTTYEEKKKGSLLPGYFADMIILDADPTAVDPDKIKDIKVNTTIVNGKVVFQAK